MKLCIHPLRVTSKEMGLSNVGRITNELPQYWGEFSYEEICEKLSSGHTWCGGHFVPAIKKADNWDCQQVFAIDVDNNLDNPTEIEPLFDHYLSLGYPPSFAYESLSSKPDHLKFRMVWITEDLIDCSTITVNFKRWLIVNSKGYADSCTINLDRLYFGGKNLVNWYSDPIPLDKLPQVEKKQSKRTKLKRMDVPQDPHLFTIACLRLKKAMADPPKGPWITRYKTIFNGAVSLVAATNGYIEPEFIYEFIEKQMDHNPDHWANYHHSLDEIREWIDRAYGWALDNVFEE